MAQILWGAGLTTAVALSSGLLLLQLLRIPLKGLDRASLAFVTGSALLSVAVFLLAAAGCARKEVFLGFGAVAIGAAAWRGAFRLDRSKSPLSRATRIAAAIPFAVYTCIYFLHAMAPEFSPDGSYYHLGFVSLYNDRGGLVKVTDNIFAHMPQGVEMLFLHAFAFGKHSAASLVHFTFLIALAVLVYSFGKRIGQPLAGLFAAFAVYASPAAGWNGTCAYIDVAVAAAVFAMFSMLHAWKTSGSQLALIPAGLLGGFAFGSKYTAFVAIPFALALVLLGGRKCKPVSVGLFLLSAAVPSAPWLIRNWIWIGNPFSPFLARWFPNPYVFPAFERELAELVSWTPGLSGWSAVPLELTVRGEYVQGLFGPLFLLAPLALLSCRTWAGRALCGGAVVFAAAYPLNIASRFLIPSIPFIALAMALVIAKNKALLALLWVAHAITAFPAVVDRYCAPHTLRLGPAPTLAEAFRKVPEDEFLRNKHFGYDAARMVERCVPPHSEVFAFISFPEAYSRKKALLYFTSARANMVTETIFTAINAVPLFGGRRMLSGLNPDLAPTCELDYRFEPQHLRGIRFVQPADTSALWVITDISLYSGEREIPFPPRWSASASVCPWYAGLAFDRSPVTHWSSREPVRKGMSLGAEFNGPVRLDRVRVIAPPDQRNGIARLEGLTPEGRWVVLRERPAASSIPLPPVNFRTLAMQEVRRRGIEYVLMNEGNLVGDDLRAHRADWRIRPVAQAENFTLYRIE